jgi:hypothetical protein
MPCRAPAFYFRLAFDRIFTGRLEAMSIGTICFTMPRSTSIGWRWSLERHEARNEALRVALRTRRFADEHGERRKRPESNQLEFHHAGHAQRKFLQESVRLCGAFGVDDEDDAVALRL